MAAVAGFGIISNTSALLALFAALSLAAWIVLRRTFRHPSSAARIVTRDINDN
jgi:hypothetical protein